MSIQLEITDGRKITAMEGLLQESGANYQLRLTVTGGTVATQSTSFIREGNVFKTAAPVYFLVPEGVTVTAVRVYKYSDTSDNDIIVHTLDTPRLFEIHGAFVVSTLSAELI